MAHPLDRFPLDKPALRERIKYELDGLTRVALSDAETYELSYWIMDDLLELHGICHTDDCVAYRRPTRAGEPERPCDCGPRHAFWVTVEDT